MVDITVIILTKNEEKNLKKCIESFRGIARRFVIVDSFSTDRTCLLYTSSVGIMTALGTFLITQLFITPKYESTTKIYILNKQENNAVTYSDIQLGTQLTKDYAELIQSRFVLEEVVQGMGLDLSLSLIHILQWDESANAGFTAGTPWIRCNPNYTVINAQEELVDQDSIFHYYKKLIALRKKENVLVEGWRCV